MIEFNVSNYNTTEDYLELKEQLLQDFPNVPPQLIELQLFRHFRDKWLKSLKPKQQKKFLQTLQKVQPPEKPKESTTEIKVYHTKEEYEESLKGLTLLNPNSSIFNNNEELETIKEE